LLSFNLIGECDGGCGLDIGIVNTIILKRILKEYGGRCSLDSIGSKENHCTSHVHNYRRQVSIKAGIY
jgi:hypothetical protein